MSEGVDPVERPALPGDRARAQFIRFVVVGALNTVFGYAVFALLIMALMPPQPALLLTYVVGVIFNFWTTGRWVFGHARLDAFPRFVFAYMIIYLFNSALFHGIGRLDAPPLVAQALCIPIVAVFAFFLLKFRVFRSKP